MNMEELAFNLDQKTKVVFKFNSSTNNISIKLKRIMKMAQAKTNINVDLGSHSYVTPTQC